MSVGVEARARAGSHLADMIVEGRHGHRGALAQVHITSGRVA